jgi:integral membrane protein
VHTPPSGRLHRLHRALGFLDGVAYVVLLGAVVLRRLADGPDVVPVAGLAHGVLYLCVVALTFGGRRRLGWDPTTVVVVLLAGALPFGTVIAGRRAVRPRG